MPITYVNGDATQPQGEGPRVILHVCNNARAWGAGFVLAVSKRWPAPERAYRASPDMTLGAVEIVPVEPQLWVANMIAQDGYGSGGGRIPLRYEALAECLQKVAVFARRENASLHGPRFGAGLAGGQWPEIERLINEHLGDLSVTIYDFKL